MLSYNCAARIGGLSRFFIRKRTLSSILSDNGTNFTSEEVQQFILSRNAKWNFIPPATLWWIGVYERIIRYVKRCMKKNISY